MEPSGIHCQRFVGILALEPEIRIHLGPLFGTSNRFSQSNVFRHVGIQHDAVIQLMQEQRWDVSA